IYNEFDFDELHPDVDNVRPGQITIDQFAWIPYVGLGSGTVGLLGDNRYGGSIGAARPVAGGRVMAAAQLDLPGFVAFNKSGLDYSDPTTWSSYAGMAWNLPIFDAEARVRAGQFLYGDKGIRFDFRRAYGDFEYTAFIQRSAGRNVEGV